MADRTAIQWTDATWNPWHGCAKVSPGCDHCYMFTEKKAYGQNPERVVRSKTKFRDPLKWTEPRLVFTCSWSDFFHAEADLWRPEAWEIIRQTPQHTYQILTKRHGRILRCLPDDWGQGYPNVWLGVSVENQEWADHRIPVLLRIPAVVRWISAEPLLGEIDLTRVTHQLGSASFETFNALYAADALNRGHPQTSLDWVVVGGESGPGARTMDLGWVHAILTQGREANVPVFVKQLGAQPIGWGRYPATRHLGETGVLRLEDRKGGDVSEWPEDLRIREWPRSGARVVA